MFENISTSEIVDSGVNQKNNFICNHETSLYRGVGPTSFKTIFQSSAKDIRKAYLNDIDNKRIIISKNLREFALLDDYIDLYNLILETEEQYRIFYECVENVQQKPRFDIEFKYESFPNITKEEAYGYVRLVIDAIGIVMQRYNVNYAFEKNCVLFLSHGISKTDDGKVEYYKYSF